MREPKVYTCNCKTPLYQAAPVMYEALEDICKVLKTDGRFPNVVPELEKLLKKARGEK